MRKQILWIAVAGVTLAFVGMATAQPPQRGQRGGMGGGGASPARLLANEDVQKELKLTDEQKEKIKSFAQARGPGGDAPPAGEEKARRRPGGGGGGGQPNPEATAAAEKFVSELSTEQQKRFKQIRIQAMGLQAFAEADVQTALKFTDEQKTKVKELMDDFSKERGELMPRRGEGGGGGNPGDAMEKVQALTKQFTEKVQSTLTDDQKSAWKDLIGAPFELRRRTPPTDR